ncbi:S-adenosyl-L-methionine-dependent methyltransferase, partial [Basidiobolus meristosporus CBS 931.73]
MASSVSSISIVNFDTEAPQYDQVMGGCTRNVAPHLIALSKPITKSSKILDDCCGTGMVTVELLETCPLLHEDSKTAKIHAVDLSKPMTDILRGRLAERNWSNLVEVGVMNGQDLGFEADTFTHCFMNMAIFLFPDPLKGLKEVHRTLKKGGSFAMSTWKYLGYVPILNAVQKAISPSDKLFESPLDQKWEAQETLQEFLPIAGFGNVK